MKTFKDDAVAFLASIPSLLPVSPLDRELLDARPTS